MQHINISSTTRGIEGLLSTFTVWEEGFTMFGETFHCLEVLLEGIKVPDPIVRSRVLGAGNAREAKKLVGRYGTHWRKEQKLFLQDKAVGRNGPEYQQFLNDAFTALYAMADFKQALVDSEDYPLLYSKGDWNRTRTVLTAQEFCGRLEHLRTHGNLDGYAS